MAQLMRSRVLQLFLALLLCLPGLVTQAYSAQGPIELGRDYELVAPPQPPETGKKIEVLEIFWYGCPHCFALEPELNKWLKQLPKDVEFRRMPGIFRDNWVQGAKVFYTFEALGLTNRLHGDMFNAIHVDGINFDDDRTLFDWVQQHGVNRRQFADTYSSFAVQSKVLRARQLTKAYGINGVPSIIVDGKYRTAPSMAGSYPALFNTLDQLIKKARQDRSRK
jgi:thiol:disulfide interchange protein DsbA